MRFRPLLVVAGSLLGAACSGDAPSGGDVLVVSSVEVTPPSASLTVGGTLQLTAVGKTSGGVEVTDRAARWSSSNAAVASVSSSGLVTGSALGGPITITATIDRASATASITVTPTPVATVTIEPAQAQIEVGAAVQFSATARGAQGQPLEGRPVAWESENPAIATVTTTGSAIGVTVGVTTIRATSEGKAGTATLTVVPRPATRLGFTTPPGNGVAGQPLGPVRVAVQDNIGGTVTTATTAITLGLADNPGGATLGGTLTAAAVQGVATFSDLVLNRAAAGYTLRASAAPLSPALSPPFTIVASAATALAITTQPSSAAQSGAALPQQPVVQLQDGLGNPVPQAGVTVTATLVGTGGTLSGQAAVVTNASGAAVFTNLVLSGPVGSYTLRFATAGLPEVQSNAITLGAGGAAALQIVTQPSSTAANGTPLATQPSVRLVDGGGNLVSQGGVTITASIVGGGATVSSGATATTNASGVATFSGLALTGPAGSYSLSFSGPGLTAVTSAGITLGAGPPVALSVARQPSTSAQSGVAFPVQPQVRVVDAGGNASAASGVVITAALASGAGTLGGTLTATTNASGLATFTDLAVTGPSGTYTIRFTAPGLSQVVSGVIGLGAGVATQVVITAQPAAAAQSGVALTAQPVVQIRDAANNPVPTAGVAVTAEIASGGGTLGGTVTITTNTSGIATFTDLSIAGLVGDRTLRFTSPGLASAVSGTIVLAAGPAARLALSTQPSASVVNAQPFPQQPVAQLQDASGNSVSQAGVDVTVSIATGGGVLGGTATVSTVAGGSATFTNLAITGLVGGRTLAFAATGLAGVTSGTVTVTPGPASKLGITTQPSSTAQSGVAFAQQPVVQVQDASGNAVSQASVSVTAASSGGTLGGTATVVTSASGTATFTGLSITGTPGPYTIGFTATGLTSATSSTITLGAGVASQLAMVIQPPASAQSGVIFGTAPAVQLLDATGNPVPAAGVSVTVALVGGGTLGGVLTQVTDGTGKAAFPGLSITGLIGDRTLQFTASGVTAAASNTIALSAGPAARLAVAVQPAATAQSGVALSPQPQVQVQDGAGNSVSANGVAITASIASGTGGSLTGNTIAVTNASGLATFTNLTLSGTAGPFTLGFAASGLTPTASNVIALAAGAPTVLGITTQPSPSVQSGVDFPQQPVVQLQDGFSNPVAQAGVSVSVTIQSGGGTLGGTTTVSTNLSGQAVFTNLRITGVIGDRTLLFAASGYVGVSSNTVTVTAGAATALAMVTQPSASAQSGVPFPVQPSVRLVDQNGNAVSQASVSVTAAVASGGGTLGGTTTVTTDGTGLAQFTNLAITGTPGPRTLSFASTGLTGTTSASISLAAGPASQLTLTTPPPATATNGQPLAPQPAVQLRDGAGTAVAQAGVTVNAVIATSPGGTPSLAGGSAVTDVNGLATFSGLAISGTVGGYTLRFESGSLTPVTSGGITLVAGAASQLTLTTQPSANAQNTVAFPQQPVVQLRDAGGNAVSQSGVTVTASIATGTGTLGGTTAVATVNGVATFTNLSLTGTLGGFTLQFSATGLTSVTSGTITLAAGPPASLVMFRQPPSTATSGVAFPNPPTVVRVLDANGNDVNGATVTASVASGPGGASLVGSATAISGSNGQAAFNGLGILGLVGNYTLGFSTPGATGVTSTAISLSAGAAAKLALTTSPSATVRNDQAFPVQPVVQIQDLAGNPLTPNGTPITAAITSGSVTLGGTTSVNTIDGTAAFTNLKITGTTGARTLTFSSGSLTPVNSGSVNVLAGTATAIAIVTQPPASVASGATMAASVVDLRDVSGNDVDSAGVAITVAIASGGGTLDGTPSQLTGGNGQASFGDLSITGTPGNRTLSFSGTSLTAATSNAVSVTAPVATQLAITTQPASTARSGIPLGTVPVVQARDASNNPVSGVTISVAVNGGGTPSGTTSGVTDGSGNVTFTGLTITGLAGIKSLTFSSGALPTVQSANITLGAGAATQLALTTGPGGGANGTPLSPQPVVQVRDAQGNPLDTALTVTATIATSPGGTPSLTNESASTGGGNSATFSGLTVTGQAGSYTLTFSADALTVTSGPLTLTAGSPTSMTFQTAPSGTAQSGVALGTQPAVLLTDQSGNPVNGVTVSAALLSGTGSVSGGTSAVTSSGVATFSGLVIDAQAGAVTLRFTAGGLTLDSGNIAVSAGPATQLVVTTQPVGAASGAPLNTQPVVVFRDSGNNLVNTTAAVTAVLVGAGGTLSGTTTVNAVGGIATFTNLVVAGTGTYTLRFDAGSLSIPSSSFDITP